MFISPVWQQCKDISGGMSVHHVIACIIFQLHKVDEFEGINFVINILDILRETPFIDINIAMVEESEDLS